MKTILLFFATIFLIGCGKTKIDAPIISNNNLENTSGSNVLVKCESIIQCKSSCDGSPITGTKAECDYEQRKNFSYQPNCTKLYNCYGSRVDPSKYSL